MLAVAKPYQSGRAVSSWPTEVSHVMGNGRQAAPVPFTPCPPPPPPPPLPPSFSLSLSLSLSHSDSTFDRDHLSRDILEYVQVPSS